MMDPEMFRLAQEQMSRIPPDEFMRMQQQIMSNSDLIRMATEGMKNLRAEDMRMAAEQMKRLRPEDMAEMSSRLANVSPEELVSMRVQADVQRAYELQGAQSLKNQGNQLHGLGKYSEAIEKYFRAKENLSRLPTSEAVALRRACSLNLMSCYLKTGEFNKTIFEGTEVLETDPNNLKALYRRGQAYKELGNLKLALKDLSKAGKVAPDDETVQETLWKFKEQLGSKGAEIEEELLRTDGPIIEEISGEEADVLTAATSNTSCRGKEDRQVPPPSSETSGVPDMAGLSDTVDSLKQNPEMIRSMHSMMSTLSPEQIAAMSGGQMTPDMVKMALDMVKHMSAADMERMFEMMPSQKQGTADVHGFPRSPAASERGEASLGTAFNLGPSSGQGFPAITPEMQEEMRQCMKDPAMNQMMSSMLKNMTPESMVTMSEQMGVKLSREEAEKAQEALANLSPDTLKKMMKWADRAQQAVTAAKKGKDFVLGKWGLVLAIVMLLIAALLHWWGVIGG